MQKNGVKTSNKLRVVQYEPAVSDEGKGMYQFEDHNHYYAFNLLPKEEKRFSSVLENISTNLEQEVEIQYYQSGGEACLKSLKVEGKVFEVPEVTRRCDLYVSVEKLENEYHHIRIPKRRLTVASIKQFLKTNPSMKKYKSLIIIQAVSPGMPLNVLEFIWGQPESKFTDEEKFTLFTYQDWYVSVKNNKVFSFSSRDPESKFNY